MDKENKKPIEAQEYGHTYDGGVTEKQIEQWKRQHRKVMRIDVADGDELHIGYFHRPSLETMAAVQKVTAENEIRGAETMLKGCWLGGSEYLLTDAALFNAVSEQLGKVLNGCASSLKNL